MRGSADREIGPGGVTGRPGRIAGRGARSAAHKYHAKACVVDGIRFASQKEAKRYGELKLLEKAGEIHQLELQPRWELLAGYSGFRVGEYRADFTYCECRRGAKCERTRVIVEDVKGFRTPLYKWKKKHVEAQYGIVIREL